MYHSYEGIILSRRVLGENNRLLTVFTHGGGKQELLAVGAQKISAKMAGSLGPLTRVFLSTVRGKVHSRIIGVDILDQYPDIQEDVYRVSLASLLLQVVDRFTEENQKHQEMFGLLIDSLEVLRKQTKREGSQRLISAFILQMLSLSGWRPDINTLRASDDIRSILKDLLDTPIRELDTLKCSSDAAVHVTQITKKILSEQLGSMRPKSELPAMKFFYEMARVVTSNG